MSGGIPSVEELNRRLRGYRLPGGEVTVAPHEAWLGNDAMAVASPGGAMNPVWFLVIALRGMGTTIGHLVELAETTVADGLLFGELHIEQRVPLQPGVRYRVTGTIDSITRRTGGRIGTFDILAFTLEVVDPAGTVSGKVTCSFILPRKSEAGHE